MIREFLEAEGAIVARMSGSGSTIFGIVEDERAGKTLEEKVRGKFSGCWTGLTPA
jgi:4-diphosphocytidyl-2C-methyl-D-erythritol kinase